MLSSSSQCRANSKKCSCTVPRSDFISNVSQCTQMAFNGSKGSLSLSFLPFVTCTSKLLMCLSPQWCYAGWRTEFGQFCPAVHLDIFCLFGRLKTVTKFSLSFCGLVVPCVSCAFCSLHSLQRGKMRGN